MNRILICTAIGFSLWAIVFTTFYSIAVNGWLSGTWIDRLVN